MTEKRRQPLTQARRPGPIRSWGEPRAAAALVRALDVASEDPRGLTHGFHPYAARMHPATARRAIEALGKPSFLLDPFCGSGTVLVEALRAGIASAGVDLSPLAILIARARTWPAPPAARRELAARARAIAEAVLAEGKAARRAETPAAHRRLTQGQKRILTGAFLPHIHRELEALAAAVDAADDDILRAVLSSIVVKLSRRTGERGLARGMAARLFADRAAELAAALDDLWRHVPAGTPPPIIIQSDTRAYRGEQGRLFDAVLTSPPYPGTYDYAEQHELPLALLGKISPTLRQSELGARRKLEEDVEQGLARWEEDFTHVLTRLARMLRPGGKVIMLMGDSIVGRPPIARAVLVDATAERLAARAGMKQIAGAAAERDKLGAGEGRAFGTRPKAEHLLMFQT